MACDGTRLRTPNEPFGAGAAVQGIRIDSNGSIQIVDELFPLRGATNSEHYLKRPKEKRQQCGRPANVIIRGRLPTGTCPMAMKRKLLLGNQPAF